MPSVNRCSRQFRTFWRRVSFARGEECGSGIQDNNVARRTSGAAKHTSLDPDSITHDKVEKVKKLNDIAKARRQSLAQMAVAWTLRDKVVTSSLIGASKVAHVEEAVAALNNTAFSAAELSAIESALK